MELWGETVTFSAGFFLLLALALALSFEFVNGFHDTANAVATVIYTNSLKPVVAVIWSGIWNLIGVLTSSGLVAYSIVALLPVELVLNVGSGAGFAMVFALLLSAIIWNVGTWYLGLPASSSHSLIGAIMGVGLANALISGQGFVAGINWAKAKDIGAALLLSPLVGFVCAGLLLLVFKFLIRREDLYNSPEKGTKPPLWIRAILVGTCTGVSFAHGSNDGQKGMGLIMLILVGLLPGAFAINMTSHPEMVQATSTEMRQLITILQPLAGTATVGRDDAVKTLAGFVKPTGGKATVQTFAAMITEAQTVIDNLGTASRFQSLPQAQRRSLRTDFYLLNESLGKITKTKAVADPAALGEIKKTRGELDKLVKYIPVWVKVVVALALGLGTMIGWKRIVVTVGEKIGKAHLTYAQGAAAELVAMATIEAADIYGLPVSTTHVLSSGIAGTMAANRSGLQAATLRNIVLAWVLTLPACVFLGATLFAAGLFVTFNLLGIR